MQAAKDAVRRRSDTWFWMDHAIVRPGDFEWLADVQRLTLWNVKVPPVFFARLPKLRWLDIRGGSGSDLELLRGSENLEFLSLNQIRGLSDLSLLSEFRQLRLLDLYGLSQLVDIPSLASLVNLERAQLGQLRNLRDLGSVLDAPHLRELYLLRKIGVSARDVERINAHPSLRAFTWMSEDVPLRVSEPVVDRIALPRAPSLHPEEWFDAHS